MRIKRTDPRARYRLVVAGRETIGAWSTLQPLAKAAADRGEAVRIDRVRWEDE